MAYIKNLHKKHKIEADGKYACIKAVNPTPEKSTRVWKEVTCKNCLRKRPKQKYPMGKSGTPQPIEKPQMVRGLATVDKICKHCGVKFNCHKGIEADITSLCHKCAPAEKSQKKVMEHLTEIKDNIEILVDASMTGKCVVCREKHEDDRIVIYTGRPVCRGCAKGIIKEFMETL